MNKSEQGKDKDNTKKTYILKMVFKLLIRDAINNLCREFLE